MRRLRVVVRFVRWGMTLVTLVLGTASGLAMFYSFGVIKTTPYPGYAPKWADYVMMNGGIFYSAGQGMGHASANSPYVVIGTHWTWHRNRQVYVPQLWSRPKFDRRGGGIWIPAWLIVGPPFAATVGLWAPVVFRRRRRAGECECGYDLTGVVSGVCPECGRDDGGVGWR